ncbi:MAG: Lipoprotein [Microgenomates group bacterium Gr01-1014_80]|nr:MAG: Lipoprotein [Microgenomates group bacterium Gr01-1014_80]
MYTLREDLKALARTLIVYIKHKIAFAAAAFEAFKNFSVDKLMLKRGKMQSRVWHGSMVGLAFVGLLTSGVFGGQSLVSSAYPGVGGSDPRFVDSFEPFPNGEVLEGLQDPNTTVSAKPRSEIIDYEVQSGDTLSSVAKKFAISTDTVKWANNMDNVDAIKPGQTLRILPVTGVAHTVKSGDTLESVAKRYQSEAQAMVDFPFNDIPDDFRLRAGQVLIVPDGSPPEAAKPKARPQPQYIARGPSSPAFEALGGGKFVWPTSTSGVSQYYAWYHPGIDMPNKSAPGIAASDGGTVVIAGWPDGMGYGNRVVVDHENGYRTLYAHLSNVYVSVGQTVSRGQIIGQMGSTGRSTGTHLHFEIHYKGVPVNPLAILK